GRLRLLNGIGRGPGRLLAAADTGQDNNEGNASRHKHYVSGSPHVAPPPWPTATCMPANTSGNDPVDSPLTPKGARNWVNGANESWASGEARHPEQKDLPGCSLHVFPGPAHTRGARLAPRLSGRTS